MDRLEQVVDVLNHGACDHLELCFDVLQSKQVLFVVCHEDFLVHRALLPAVLLVKVSWLRPCEGGKVLVVFVTNRYVVICLIITAVAAPLGHFCFNA